MTLKLGVFLPFALFLLSKENANQWSALAPPSCGPLHVEAFSMSSSFSGTGIGRSSLLVQRASTASKKHGQKNAIQLSMVIDRLSDECIAATQVSHKIGNEIGLRLLRNEVLVAGITNRPEKAGRTLARYNLLYPLVRKGSEKVLEQNGFQLKPKVNRDTLLTTDKSLPFSEDVKLTLTVAAQIADHFNSKAIHSEHVMLALLGYSYGKPMDQQNVPVGLQVLRNSENVVDAKFSAYDFCEDLVLDMKLPYDLSDNPVTEEMVVIGGGSTRANTLEEVGVDLTQMAVEGKLDRVYGRDKEIVMALRTLGRRRKNNPCLIGDPGVGKVSLDALYSNTCNIQS